MLCHDLCAVLDLLGDTAANGIRCRPHLRAANGIITLWQEVGPRPLNSATLCMPRALNPCWRASVRVWVGEGADFETAPSLSVDKGPTSRPRPPFRWTSVREDI